DGKCVDAQGLEAVKGDCDVLERHHRTGEGFGCAGEHHVPPLAMAVAKDGPAVVDNGSEFGARLAPVWPDDRRLNQLNPPLNARTAMSSQYFGAMPCARDGSG